MSVSAAITNPTYPTLGALVAPITQTTQGGRAIKSGIVCAIALAAFALVSTTASAGRPVRSGSLYIPNFDGHTSTQGRVFEFDSRTGEFKKVLIPSLGIDLIQGMTLGPDRNLYLGVMDTVSNQNGRILRYSLDGTPLGEFVSPGEGGFVFPIGLRFGPDGSLYVVSNSPSIDSVLRFTQKKGEFDGVVASNLITPQDIVFGPDGSLFVSNGNANASSIYQFDPVEDSFVGAFVPTRTGGLWGPMGMAFGPDHNLYVVSRFSESILKFDGNTGEFIGEFASLDGLDCESPTDLVFGPDGNLYVLARGPAIGGGTVVRFDGTTGSYLDVFVEAGAAGLGLGDVGMLFIDEECSRYGDSGFSNRCFTPRPERSNRRK